MALGLCLKLVLVYSMFFVRKDSGEPLRAGSIRSVKHLRNHTEEQTNMDDAYPDSQHQLVPITDIDYLEKFAASGFSIKSRVVSIQDGISLSEHTTTTDISPDGDYKMRRFGPNDGVHSESLSYLKMDRYKRRVTVGTPLPYDQITSLRSISQREQTSSEWDTTQRGEHKRSGVIYIRVKSNYAAKDNHTLVLTKSSEQAPNRDRVGQLNPFTKYLSPSDFIKRKGSNSYQHVSSAGSDGWKSQKALELIQGMPSTATRDRFYTTPTSQPAWGYLDMSKSYKAKLFDSHPVALSHTNYTGRLNLQNPAVSESQRKGAVQWLVLKSGSSLRGADETGHFRTHHHHQPSATKESVSTSTDGKIPSQFQVSQIRELRPINPGVVPKAMHVTRGSMHNVPPSEIQPFQVSPIIQPQKFPTSLSYQISQSVNLKNIGDSRQWQTQTLSTVSTQNTKVPSTGGPVVRNPGSDGSTVRDHLSITSDQVSETSIVDDRETPRHNLSTDQAPLGEWSPVRLSESIQNHNISRESRVFVGSAASHDSKPIQKQIPSASTSTERRLTIKGDFVSDGDIQFTSAKHENHSHDFKPQESAESISSSHSNPATLASPANQSGIRFIKAKMFNLPKEVHLDSNQSHANHGNNEMGDAKYIFQKYSSHAKASQRPTSSVVVVKLIKTYTNDNRTESENQNGSENKPAVFIQPQEPTDQLPIFRRKSTSNVKLKQNNTIAETQERFNQSTEAQIESSVAQVEVDPIYTIFRKTDDSKAVPNESAAQSIGSFPRQLPRKHFKPVHSSDVSCSTSFSTHRKGQAEPLSVETVLNGNICSASDSKLAQATTGLVSAAAREDVQPTITIDTITQSTEETAVEP